MKKSYLKFVASAALVASVVTGCGSSASSTSSEPDLGYNGIFVDSAAGGVNWSCDNVSGLTDADGHFGACPTGSSVTFSLGTISLGTMPAPTDNIFSVRELGAVAHPEDPNAATRIAQLLLSLDSDGNPDNGISVTSTGVAALETSVPAGTTSVADIADDEIDQVVADTVATAIVTDPGLNAVDSSTANAHLDATDLEIENGEITAPEQPTAPVVTGA